MTERRTAPPTVSERWRELASLADDNRLEMRHYCTFLKDVCPNLMHPTNNCKCSNSVHFFTGDAFCAETL